MMPQEFHQPWSEIDPSGGHGGIPGELGEYVGARLGDNPRTKNIDMHTIFQVVRDCAAALSVHPAANMEGPPDQKVVEETLRGLNYILERMLDRTKTQATGSFFWEHATPPFLNFRQRPIRYPLRSIFVNSVIYHLLGDMVEVAEMNVNAQHSWMDPSTAQRVMAPLIHLKGNIIRDWFDQECADEVSLDELSGLFAKITRPGPSIVPAGTSQEAPSTEDTNEALSGVNVIQWFPSPEQWNIFSRKRTELMKTERIWQPEGAGTTTEDVAPENPVRTPLVAPG
jgi:hypothetical protein